MSYYPSGFLSEDVMGPHRITRFVCGCVWDRFYYQESDGRITHDNGPTASTCAAHTGGRR